MPNVKWFEAICVVTNNEVLLTCYWHITAIMPRTIMWLTSITLFSVCEKDAWQKNYDSSANSVNTTSVRVSEYWYLPGSCSCSISARRGTPKTEVPRNIYQLFLPTTISIPQLCQMSSGLKQFVLWQITKYCWRATDILLSLYSEQ